MKTKTVLSILALTLTLSAFSQSTFELTFTAKSNGQHTPLDSTFIKNLTQDCDTTLYWPDTVLILDYVTNIVENISHDKSNFYLSQNYPNPFIGRTEVILHLAKTAHITITVHNIFGKELLRYENTISRGNHSFIFYSGNEAYYFLTVNDEQTSKTIKMLSVNSIATHGGKCKIIYNGYNDNTIGFKAQKSTNNFVFALSDTLRFIGYAKTEGEVNGSDIIEDIPIENYNYEFQITEGIPCPGTPTVTDVDGNVYNTVQIGGQCWMKENLRVGTRINGSQDMSDNSIIEKYCSNNDPANCEIYGGLYQWNEMMQYSTVSGIRGICPDGWHLPGDDEWKTMEMTLGMSQSEADNTEWRGTDEGGKMKETGYAHWDSPNTGATNSSGFTALPGGLRYSNGTFGYISDSGYWWSTTESSGTSAWLRHLYYPNVQVYRGSPPKTVGYSVRCLKN